MEYKNLLYNLRYSYNTVFILLYKHLFAIDNVQALAWGLYSATLQIACTF